MRTRTSRTRAAGLVLVRTCTTRIIFTIATTRVLSFGASGTLIGSTFPRHKTTGFTHFADCITVESIAVVSRTAFLERERERENKYSMSEDAYKKYHPNKWTQNKSPHKLFPPKNYYIPCMSLHRPGQSLARVLSNRPKLHDSLASIDCWHRVRSRRCFRQLLG